MNTIQDLIRIDQQIHNKKTLRKTLLNEIATLELKREKLAGAIKDSMGELNSLTIDGFTFHKRLSPPKVELKEGVTVDALPDVFKRTSPDKAAIAKAYKQSPKLVESFASVTQAETLTYKLEE